MQNGASSTARVQTTLTWLYKKTCRSQSPSLCSSGSKHSLFSSARNSVDHPRLTVILAVRPLEMSSVPFLRASCREHLSSPFSEELVGRSNRFSRFRYYP